MSLATASHDDAYLFFEPQLQQQAHPLSMSAGTGPQKYSAGPVAPFFSASAPKCSDCSHSSSGFDCYENGNCWSFNSDGNCPARTGATPASGPPCSDGFHRMDADRERQYETYGSSAQTPWCMPDGAPHLARQPQQQQQAPTRTTPCQRDGTMYSCDTTAHTCAEDPTGTLSRSECNAQCAVPVPPAMVRGAGRRHGVRVCARRVLWA